MIYIYISLYLYLLEPALAWLLAFTWDEPDLVTKPLGSSAELVRSGWFDSNRAGGLWAIREQLIFVSIEILRFLAPRPPVKGIPKWFVGHVAPFKPIQT